MTPQEARKIANAEIDAYNARVQAWNNWTDVNNADQHAAWLAARAEYETALDALRNADTQYPHLFAIFSGQMVAH